MWLEYIPEIFLSISLLAQLNFNAWFRNQSVYFKFPIISISSLQTQIILLFTAFLYLYLPETSFMINSFFLLENLNIVKLVLTLIAFFISLSIEQSLLSQKIAVFEYYTLFLLALLSFLLMLNCNDLLSFYLLMELQALIFYVLASFNKNSVYSVSAGLKYFILGSFISGFYLLGCSFVYFSLGTLNLNEIFLIVSFSLSDYNLLLTYLLTCGLVLVLITLLFKLGIFPFYFWIPDVYEGSPVVSTMIFSVLPKISLYVFLIKILSSILFFDYLYIIKTIFVFLGISSTFVGTFYALNQKRLKRMLIYSSIVQNGFLIVALSIYTVTSMQAFFFFLILYLLTSILTWSMITFFYRSNKIIASFESSNSSILYINSISNVYPVNVFLGLSIVVIFSSLAGIPPFLGFFSKMFVINEMVGFNVYLAIIFLLLSVVSVFYYIRLIKIAFFEPSISNNNTFFVSFKQTENFGLYYFFYIIFLFLSINFIAPSFILILTTNFALI